MIPFGTPNAKTGHTYFEERLSAYLDDELLPQEQAAVKEHLDTCPDCQWDLDTLRQTVQWTRELPTLTVPRVFTVPAPAEPERAARRRWRLVPVMQGATALIALLLFFVVAGDFLLPGWFQQASAPESMMVQATAPAEEAVTLGETLEVEAPAEEAVTVVETVVVEASVEAQKVMAEPTQSPLPAAAEPAAPAEPAAEATEIEGVRAEMAAPAAQEAVTEEPEVESPVAEAPPPAAQPPGETQALDAIGGGALTPTLLAPTLRAAVTSTDGAEATELAFVPQDEGEPAAGHTWGGRGIDWVRVAEYVLGVAFVAFLAGTVVAMLLQRRVL